MNIEQTYFYRTRQGRRARCVDTNGSGDFPITMRDDDNAEAWTCNREGNVYRDGVRKDPRDITGDWSEEPKNTIMTTKCRICGGVTVFTGTKICSRCSEHNHGWVDLPVGKEQGCLVYGPHKVRLRRAMDQTAFLGYVYEHDGKCETFGQPIMWRVADGWRYNAQAECESIAVRPDCVRMKV